MIGLHQNMTTPAVRIAIGAALVLLTITCGSNPASSTAFTNTLHTEVVDSAGDAVASLSVPNPPDLVHGTVDVVSGNITFTIQFARGTLDSQSTHLTIELDTDENVSTGITGASGLGIDYVVDVWAARTNQTLVQQAMPATCSSGGACYVQIGTESVSVGTDSLTTTVPLSMLGTASGRLNFRVFAYASPQATTPTVVADVMPDITLPPAHVS